MTIEWLDENQNKSNTLEWLKDYVASGLDASVPTCVNSVYVCSGGLLLLTDEWKAFIYKGSNMYKQLAEALEAYTSSDRKLPRFVACGTNQGAVRCGLDSSVIDAAWVKHGREYAQLWEEYGSHEAFERKTTTNPFLPPPSPRSDNARNEQQPSNKRATRSPQKPPEATSIPH